MMPFQALIPQNKPAPRLSVTERAQEQLKKQVYGLECNHLLEQRLLDEANKQTEDADHVENILIDKKQYMQNINRFAAF